MYRFVEERIQESIDNGDFENLPGKGKPLDLRDELQGLSPELRMGYKLLKNAGYLSENTDKNKERLTINDLITTATGKEGQPIARDQHKLDQFVHERKLHKNNKFTSYAHKIYLKLFPGKRMRKGS